MRWTGLALMFVASYVAFSLAGLAGCGVVFVAAIGSAIHYESLR